MIRYFHFSSHSLVLANLWQMNFQFCHEKGFLLKKYEHKQKSTSLHLKTTIFAHSQNRMDCCILEHFQQIEFFSLCLNITFKVFQIQNERKSDIVMKFVLFFYFLFYFLCLYLILGEHCLTVYHLDEFVIERERESVCVGRLYSTEMRNFHYLTR